MIHKERGIQHRLCQRKNIEYFPEGEGERIIYESMLCEVSVWIFVAISPNLFHL